MKNVNINCVFGDIITTGVDSEFSLCNIGKRFCISRQDDNRRVISQLSMVVFISATQTKDEEKIKNINPEIEFFFNEDYEIKIRLTETFSGDFTDLFDFVIVPSKHAMNDGLCKSTFNYKQLCVKTNVELPCEKQKEKYVIKILIRHKTNLEKSNEWTVQTIVPLELCNDDN
jgi:hypothetical protein